ncbi:MAG: DUF1565 domain-containing protein, partial [Bacteroidales bacterium]|nr:DUF1565 domain-containing protein [Bacteroidales bacterium]
MNYKKTKILLITILSVTAMGSRAQSLITVKQDGTGNFTTIQEGIDFAANKDTVLVWPGTYFENVILSGKTIILGSLTLTTGDPFFISQTIINGNQSGSCLVIENATDTNKLCGFTLTNGSGNNYGSNYGGAVCIYGSNVSIERCIIKENFVTGYGGGISVLFSNARFSDVTIKNNTAYVGGGGIVVAHSTVQFDPGNLCNIYLNYAASGTDFRKGIGDSSINVVVDTFTVQNPDYYYLHSSGNDILQNDITWQVNHGKIEQTEQDLFVSPQGDNENDGISAQTPLKDIWFALLKMKSDSISPDTIHIMPGTYKPSAGEKFPLSLKKYASIKGTSIDSCILDAEDEIYHMNGILNSCCFQISNLTLQHGNGFKNTLFGTSSIEIDKSPFSSLQNLIVKSNKSRIVTVRVSNSDGFLFSNCKITDNTGGHGMRIAHGGTATAYHTIKLINCIVENNIPDYSMPPNDGYLGGGLALLGPTSTGNSKRLNVQFYNCLFNKNRTRPHPDGTGHISGSLGATDNSKAYLINCTLGDNKGDSYLGAGIGVTNSSEMNIYNSILYHNDPAELYMFSLEGVNSINIYNSLVQGGEEGIRVYTSGNSIYYDPSNIDTDPMWDTTSMYPYSLASGSPCINAGTLNLPQGIELPETDLAGNPRVYNGYVDMGA